MRINVVFMSCLKKRNSRSIASSYILYFFNYLNPSSYTSHWHIRADSWSPSVEDLNVYTRSVSKKALRHPSGSLGITLKWMGWKQCMTAPIFTGDIYIFFLSKKTWSHQNKLRHGVIMWKILLSMPSFRPMIATSVLIISGCHCIENAYIFGTMWHCMDPLLWYIFVILQNIFCIIKRKTVGYYG